MLETLCNPCIKNPGLFRTEASSKACRTCKMMKRIQSTSIVRTGYSSIFKDIQAYSRILRHSQSRSQPRNQGRGERGEYLGGQYLGEIFPCGSSFSCFLCFLRNVYQSVVVPQPPIPTPTPLPFPFPEKFLVPHLKSRIIFLQNAPS